MSVVQAKTAYGSTRRGTPTIKKMRVVPVAGYDSMLLTLNGAHSPFFTRNLILLTDSDDRTGAGEICGGDDLTRLLEGYIPLVEGREIGDYKNIIQSIGRYGRRRKEFKEGDKRAGQAEAAVEIALLDLLGQFMGQPVCALLGNGQQRDSVSFQGRLFYVADQERTTLPYLREDSPDAWFRQRRKTALTPSAIVEQARVLRNKYGFRSFKLEGGVFRAEREAEAALALKKEFPEAEISVVPSGSWKLEEAIEAARDLQGVVEYIEDPCGPENGYSSREINAEFRLAAGIPVATKMFADNWRQFYHAAVQKSADIIFADPHIWSMNSSVRMAQVLCDWGLSWGACSDSHFDISLAALTHCAAAAPGREPVISSCWIWQDGQYLTENPPVIREGQLDVPKCPGLGLKLDAEAIEKAHQLYLGLESHARDDSLAMQCLIPGWSFDPKRPCLVR